MKRTIAVALVVLACRSSPRVDSPRVPEDARPPTTVEPIAPVFDDVTSTAGAVCVQHRGAYVCWGQHPAFPAMLGITDTATVLETPRAIDGHGRLRRLALAGDDVWALTERGDVIAWTDRNEGLDPLPHAKWTPALGGDIRDLAAVDDGLCVRRGEDVACWTWVRAGRAEEALAREPTIVKTTTGAAAPSGTLVETRRGIAIETASGCVEVEPARPIDVAKDTTPAPCGALGSDLVAGDGLPAGVDARERGMCLLVEGVRLFCPPATDAREGTYWIRTPQLREPDARDDRDAVPASPRPRGLVAKLHDREIVRDAKGRLVARFDDGRTAPVGKDDPVAKFVASDAWVELADVDAMLCGRTADGVVRCAFVSETPSDAPIGLAEDPAFARPPLPFAADALFVDRWICASAKNADRVCWGRQPRPTPRGDRTDVTDRVLAAIRDAR